MNNEKDIKNLDQFFKQGLEDPVDKAVFRDADWAALEQLLGNKRTGIIFWLPYLSSAAAILIVAFGWWMLRPQATSHAQKPQQQVAVTHVQKAQQSAAEGQTQLATVHQAQQVAAANENGKNNINSAAVKPAATSKPGKELSIQPQHQTTGPAYIAANTGINKRRVKGLLPGETVNTEQKGSAEISQAGIAKTKPDSYQDNTRDNEILAAVSEKPDITPNTAGSPVLASINILPETTTGSSVDPNTKAGKTTLKKTGTPYRPQYALSILASQELNGVGSLQQASGGIDAGLLFSAGLVKKFTITTGLHYSLKPYTLPFSEYHTTYKFKNAPQTVSADCRILDIPINIDYQVYNKSRNKITVGTGLSSYIMMHESYTYDYGSSDVLYGPSYYAVKTQGKYYFSIMNLEASYQRQVSSKFGISLQPYLKIPLSNIGYSQIKVETFGVAAGLNWNINSLTKPK